MGDLHWETGHEHGPKDCTCVSTGGIDHANLMGGLVLSTPPTIRGMPAAVCPTCGTTRNPPRVARRRRS